MKRRWPFLIILFIFVSAYLGGYVYVRDQHLLIHRSSYSGDVTASHSICGGDFIGIGSAARIGRQSHFFFTPQRWVETCYWYIRYPVGTPWPYF